MSDEVYNELNDFSKVGINQSLGGNYLALGKDAFNKQLNFQSLETKVSPPTSGILCAKKLTNFVLEPM